jgi:hypothetical protein
MIFSVPVLPPSPVQPSAYYAPAQQEDSYLLGKQTKTQPLIITTHKDMNQATVIDSSVGNYNRLLSTAFNRATETGNFQPFLKLIQAQLPALSPSSNPLQTQSIQYRRLLNRDLQLSSSRNAVFPMSVRVNPKGMIQVYIKGKPLFISSRRLAERQETKNNSTIVGDGIRGLDPASQKDWVNTPLQREWPPSPQQNVTHYTDIANNTLYFKAPYNPDYQVNASGMVALLPNESSVIWAYEQQNRNPEKTWGAWTIAPLDVPEGRRVVNVYPASPQFESKYAKALGSEKQWQYQREKGVVIVHPERAGSFLDPFDDTTNWTLHAVEGNDYAVVLRTVYKEDFADKAKSCIVEGRATYIENEFMAPKVKAGESSVVVCRMDFLPLSQVTGRPNDVFRKNEMDKQVSQITDYLKKNLK